MFYEGIFQPSEKMDYNAEAKKVEGKKIVVQDRWILENGPFKGQISLNLNNRSRGSISQEMKKHRKINLHWLQITYFYCLQKIL
jgi:hypothetical protein